MAKRKTILNMAELEYRRIRSDIIFEMRTFFHNKKYLEVETPLLSKSLIPERHIDVFSTDDKNNTQYLLPSPERHLKPLIAKLFENKEQKKAQDKNDITAVFEFAHCFRNSEVKDDIHRQEFIMLEFYELHKNCFDTLETCKDLISVIAQNINLAEEQQNEAGMNPRFRSMSMKEAFASHSSVDLVKLLQAAENKDIKKMYEIAQIEFSHTTNEYDFEDVFNLVFVRDVEANLPKDEFVFITHYPSLVPSLAAKDVNDPMWAQRWELFTQGMEIANCYTEETDYRIIEQFFNDQEKQESYSNKGVRKKKVASPKFFLKDPELPPCSGVALGVDRLISVFHSSRYFGI